MQFTFIKNFYKIFKQLNFSMDKKWLTQSIEAHPSLIKKIYFLIKYFFKEISKPKFESFLKILSLDLLFFILLLLIRAIFIDSNSPLQIEFPKNLNIFKIQLNYSDIVIIYLGLMALISGLLIFIAQNFGDSPFKDNGQVLIRETKMFPLTITAIFGIVIFLFYRSYFIWTAWTFLISYITLYATYRLLFLLSSPSELFICRKKIIEDNLLSLIVQKNTLIKIGLQGQKILTNFLSDECKNLISCQSNISENYTTIYEATTSNNIIIDINLKNLKKIYDKVNNLIITGTYSYQKINTPIILLINFGNTIDPDTDFSVDNKQPLVKIDGNLLKCAPIYFEKNFQNIFKIGNNKRKAKVQTHLNFELLAMSQYLIYLIQSKSTPVIEEVTRTLLEILKNTIIFSKNNSTTVGISYFLDLFLTVLTEIIRNGESENIKKISGLIFRMPQLLATSGYISHWGYFISKFSLTFYKTYQKNKKFDLWEFCNPLFIGLTFNNFSELYIDNNFLNLLSSANDLEKFCLSYYKTFKSLADESYETQDLFAFDPIIGNAIQSNKSLQSHKLAHSTNPLLLKLSLISDKKCGQLLFWLGVRFFDDYQHNTHTKEFFEKLSFYIDCYLKNKIFGFPDNNMRFFLQMLLDASQADAEDFWSQYFWKLTGTGWEEKSRDPAEVMDKKFNFFLTYYLSNKISVNTSQIEKYEDFPKKYTDSQSLLEKLLEKIQSFDKNPDFNSSLGDIYENSNFFQKQQELLLKEKLNILEKTILLQLENLIPQDL